MHFLGSMVSHIHSASIFLPNSKKRKLTLFPAPAGTAGVWRISALNEAGGWKDRTTVEDMDLAVRASLKGWKFVYVGDVKVRPSNPYPRYIYIYIYIYNLVTFFLSGEE